MLLTISIGPLLSINILLLVMYLILLAGILAFLMFKKNDRWLRMIIIALICLLFKNSVWQGIYLPISGSVRNIEYFTSLDKDIISEKDAAGKWIPIGKMIENFPGINLLMAIAIGFFAFYGTKLVKERLQSVNLIILLVSLSITAILFRTAFQQVIEISLNSIATKDKTMVANSEVDNGSGGDGSSTPLPAKADPFPVSGLLLAIGFCVLLYLFLYHMEKKGGLFINASTETVISMRLVNVTILFVLAFSVFLVISVFGAIPIFNEINKPSLYSAARLDTALSTLASNKDDSLRLNAQKRFDSIPIVDSTNTAAYIKFSVYQREDLSSQLQSLNSGWKSTISFRNSVIDRFNNYAHTYKSRQTAFQKALVNSFDINSQNATVDKTNLYESAVNRFISYGQTIKTIFERADNDIITDDNANQIVISDIKTQLEFCQRMTDSTHFQPNLIRRYFVPYPTTIDQIEQLDGDFKLEAEKRTGREWGFLGIMSEYLLDTHSPELVLLIGMIGFGLLGAALLSFAPKDDNSNFIESFSTKPLIKNFGGVLARGFGAALIVYLATKGGLALFTLGGTTSDPNGYVMLLACFIGAVFSERVWSRVSNAFASNPTPNGNPPTPQGNQQPGAGKPAP